MHPNGTLKHLNTTVGRLHASPYAPEMTQNEPITELLRELLRRTLPHSAMHASSPGALLWSQPSRRPPSQHTGSPPVPCQRPDTPSAAPARSPQIRRRAAGGGRAAGGAALRCTACATRLARRGEPRCTPSELLSALLATALLWLATPRLLPSRARCAHMFDLFDLL